VLSANALVCVDQIIIPMQAEYFSLQGMAKLIEVMELVRRRLNPDLQISMILPCMVNKRANLTNEVLEELKTHFGDVLARTFIRSNIKLAEAPSFGRTIFEHAQDSNGARDYLEVAREFLQRQGEAVPSELTQLPEVTAELEEEEGVDLDEDSGPPPAQAPAAGLPAPQPLDATAATGPIEAAPAAAEGKAAESGG
jgi:nitrogenase subunit NifH